MDENNLIKQLKDIQYVHVPKSLHEKMQQQVYQLPEKHSGFYFPLFAFQMALVGIVIVVLVGLGSGVVLAAKGSHPGTPLYPIRKMIQKVAPQILEDIPTSVPTKSPDAVTTVPSKPIPTGQEHHSIQGSGHGEDDGNIEQENNNEDTQVQHLEKKVEGTQSQDKNNNNEDDHHKGLLQELLDK